MARKKPTPPQGPGEGLPLFLGLLLDPPQAEAACQPPMAPPAGAPASRKRAPRTTWAPAPTRLLHLKITLLYTKPPIWRRILVQDSRPLRDLHHIIQVVMGWDDEHLHAFRGSRSRRDDLPERALLGDVFTRKGTKIIYEYDFGDSWEHEIRLEKAEPFDPARPEPLCLGGAFASPPEDCGGTPGYYDILHALQNPTDPENEELLEWVGEGFDPEAFDVEAANRTLHGKRRCR